VKENYGVFVRFSTRGVQKHHTPLHVKNFWLLAKKVENFFLSHRFPCRLFPSIFFYRVFGRFSA
jgi:hypothetical protein